jgi:hypothetical protein
MANEVTVVTFGESVAWGQGLAHSEKFPSIIYETLSDRPCGPLDRDLIKARSGAVVEGATQSPLSKDINRWGRHEVPHGAPTITEQIMSYPERDDPSPGDVDLVVVAGGINDVGVNTILDPTTGYQDLRRSTEHHLYSTVRELLLTIVETFPDAEVLVAGYYPLLTDESEPPQLEAFEEILGVDELTPGDYPVVGALWDRIEANAEFFHRYQLWMLTRAVADVNDWDLDTSVTFVHPGFSPENGIWGDRAMMFGPLNQDPARNVRVPACHRVHGTNAAYSGTPFEVLFNTELVRCEIASTGHPNQEGARRYAETALRRRDQHRTLSLRNLLTEVLGASGEPLETNEILKRYGLDGTDGIRSLVALREVDCVVVRIDSEFVQVKLDIEELPDWVQPFRQAIEAVIERTVQGLRDLNLVPTDVETLIDIAVHSWVDNDALATLEVDLADGETLTRPFDSRGYDVIDSPATTPVYDPLPGSTRTDVAILDPMFDEPRERLPLAAIDDVRIRMADVARQALERIVKPAFQDLPLPANQLPLEAFVSAVWQINGVEIGVNGRRIFADYSERTIESGQTWDLDYPS